jgi:hypothetical protein
VKRAELYVDLRGREVSLGGLDADERKLLARLRRRARTHPDWIDFGNFWTREVAAFYDARGLTRPEARQTAVYRVAQDLGSRLGIAAGLVRAPDYRTELEDLIRRAYPTRRAFCEATGLSEDMLSHVLAGRKNMSLATLVEALQRIGYGLHVRPLAEPKGRRAPRAGVG